MLVWRNRNATTPDYGWPLILRRRSVDVDRDGRCSILTWARWRHVILT